MAGFDHGRTRRSQGARSTRTAALVSKTIAALPVFCDLLTHVPLHLEGDVEIECARRYKTSAFAAHDEIIKALSRASTMETGQIENLLAAAVVLAPGLWQLSHPTPTLATLYEQVPRWGHAALDFAPRLSTLLTASAIGLEAMSPVTDSAAAV